MQENKMWMFIFWILNNDNSTGYMVIYLSLVSYFYMVNYNGGLKKTPDGVKRSWNYFNTVAVFWDTTQRCSTTGWVQASSKQEHSTSTVWDGNWRQSATYGLAHNFNPLTSTSKLHINGLLHSNTAIGTLAVDGWAGTASRYSEEGPGRAGAPPSPLFAVPNVTAHPSTASVPTSYYLMWHYNCLWALKGISL